MLVNVTGSGWCRESKSPTAIATLPINSWVNNSFLSSWSIRQSFDNLLDAFPFTLQVLLPQRDPIIPARHRQHVPAQAPADPPKHRLKTQHRALPLTSTRRIRRPDPGRLVLRSRRNVRFLEDRRRPRDIADPVRVAGQVERGLVALELGALQRPALAATPQAKQESAKRKESLTSSPRS